MVARSFPRATQAPVPITVLRARAEALPFPDHTFDTVVGTLVCCTIPDPRQALCELQRVSKPGGTALLFEHVRVHRPLIGRLQEWLTPVWKRLAGGCHVNRDTLALWIRNSKALLRRRARVLQRLPPVATARSMQ
jgi:ubiquinone/menaquinone biosynthesis C-methylase UbiE